MREATDDAGTDGALADDPVGRVGLDAAALKPTECDVRAAADLPVDRVTIDYEGREHVPDPDAIAALAREAEVRVTAPVRADGFDPLGDDRLYDAIPDAAGLVLVAGNPAYLDGREQRRAIAPRLGAAAERAGDPWVGTEGVERIALAAGATQFELLSPTTERDVRALRAAGFGGGVAVYAPTVLDDDEDAILDALGGYAARRAPVREALPPDTPADARAEGRAREVLRAGVEDYALVGDAGTVARRVAALKEAGVDHVVGYPARGIGAFRGRR